MALQKSGSGSVFQTPVKSPSSSGISLAGPSPVSRFAQPPKPSIPAAKDIFELQLKWILRRRLVRSVVVCAFIALAMSAAADVSSKEDWFLWSLQVGFRALVWLLGGMILPIVARKLSVRAFPPTGVTPSFKVLVKTRLGDPYNRTIALLYILSSLSFLSHDMPPVFISSRRYRFALNPQLALYITLSVSLAIWQTLRESIRMRSVVQWTKYSNISGVLSVLLKSLFRNSISTLLGNILILPVFVVVYHISLPLILRMLAYLPLQHFLLHFNRSVYSVIPYPLSVPLLISRTLWRTSSQLLGLVLRDSLVWEAANTVVDIYFAMIPRELGSDEKGVVSAVSGLSSDNEYFSHHAYNHLACLIKSSPPVRAVVYGDTKYNPNIWSTVLNTALGEKCLARDQAELFRHGAPPPVLPAVPVPPKPVMSAPGTPLHLQRQAIFKPVSQSPTQRFLDEALSSDGSAAKVLISASDSLSKVPNIFLAQAGEVKVIKESKKAAKQAEAVVEKKSLESIGMLKKHVTNLFRVPQWMKHPALEEYWSGQRQDHLVKCWVRRIELDLRAIEILETLVTRSLVEDKLGTVQRDIPKVLEAFCGYLSVVEDARDELNNLIKPDTMDEKRTEISRSLDTLEPLHRALSTAVESIVVTFGQHLNVFTFSQKTSRRIQSLTEEK